MIKMNNRIELTFLLFLLLVTALVSCQKNDAIKKQEGPLLLAYLAGDNNLSWEAQEKLEALKQGWNKDIRGKLLVYIDKQGNNNPQLIEVYSNKNGSTQSKVIKNYPQQNSASKEVLSNIIQEVKSRYTAANYNLLVFSHGTAWFPYKALSTRSVINDNRQEMELSELKEAIPDHAFTNIIFEACYMSSVEVAYALKDKTNNIFGSSAEIVSPGFTEAYKAHLNLLFKNDLSDFGREVFSEQKDGATYSLIKTAALTELADFLKANSTNNISASNNIQRYTTTNFNNWVFDFTDYYSQTLSNAEKRTDFQRLVNNCIIWKATTSELLEYAGGFSINPDKFSGLTTYIQDNNRQSINRAYLQTDWYHAITK